MAIRLLLSIILFQLLYLLSTNTVLAATTKWLGDVDKNGSVGASDYILVRKYILGTVKFDSDQSSLADYNKDKKISAADYIMIKQAIIQKNYVPFTSSPTPTAKPTPTPVVTYTCNITYNASKNTITMTGTASNNSKVKKIVIDGKDGSPYSPTKSGTYKGEITFENGGKCSKSVKATVAPSSSKTYIETYFLNTHGSGSKYTMGNVQNNEAFIIKAGGKYVLLDTGVDNSTIVKIIYDKLKELQNETTVTIDYMILSHMHTDHIGNAVNIINNKKIKINNIIMKNESKSASDVNKIVNAAKAKKINVIYTNEKYSEGQSIDLGGFVKLYFFNVKDVYSGADCSKKDRYLHAINYASSDEDGEDDTKYAKTPDGKYIYFNGKDLFDKGADMKFSTSSEVTFNKNSTSGSLINSRYYLVYGGKTSQCSPNSNSIAIVFQVVTTDGNKYVYMPSDLQNSGYSPFGEYDSTYKTTIYGYNTTYNFEYKTLSDGTLGFTLKSGKLVRNTSVTQVKRPQEYLTAKNIVNKFSDFKKNLVIYQQAHHGINNERDAINTLNVNRKGVFTIVARRGDPKTHPKYTVIEAQELLNKTTIMVAGDKKHNGIKCVVKGSGKAECAFYN